MLVNEMCEYQTARCNDKNSENCSSLPQDLNRNVPDHEAGWIQIFAVVTPATSRISKTFQVMLKSYMA